MGRLRWVQVLSAPFRAERLAPVLVLASAITLAIGLSLPLLSLETWIFWHNDYSVLTGIVGLWNDGQRVLAAVIFFFSIVFPVAKLFLLWHIWALRMDARDRERWLDRLATWGKWSMLDVFIVAILIVVAKLSTALDIEPRAGVFVFGAAVVLSMFATTAVERATRRR